MKRLTRYSVHRWTLVDTIRSLFSEHCHRHDAKHNIYLCKFCQSDRWCHSTVPFRFGSFHTSVRVFLGLYPDHHLGCAYESINSPLELLELRTSKEKQNAPTPGERRQIRNHSVIFDVFRDFFRVFTLLDEFDHRLVILREREKARGRCWWPDIVLVLTCKSRKAYISWTINFSVTNLWFRSWRISLQITSHRYWNEAMRCDLRDDKQRSNLALGCFIIVVRLSLFEQIDIAIG